MTLNWVGKLLQSLYLNMGLLDNSKVKFKQNGHIREIDPTGTCLELAQLFHSKAFNMAPRLLPIHLSIHPSILSINLPIHLSSKSICLSIHPSTCLKTSFECLLYSRRFTRCCCSVAESFLTAACQASLPFTISQNLLKFMSIESVMISNHFILCHHLHRINVQ